MEVTGFVRHALEAKKGVSQRTGNPWMARDYVLEIPGQYPKHMVFSVFGEERINQFALKKDEEVTVHFDIDAHEYQGKWYNSCQAYKVVRVGQQTVAAAPQQAPATQPFPPAQPQVAAAPPSAADGADDLPF